ncbi:MAG: response regulator [Bacteroidota bacterium]|nr:response regulator [Bacteroidota bacterium]
MPNPGPIVIIEDDIDDQELIAEVLKELQVTNQLIFFCDGTQAITYLKSTTDKPFLVLCDINMPVLNGIEVRNIINSNEYLKSKSIPFIFLTTTPTSAAIEAAYRLSVQGFFQKPASLIEMKSTLKEIVDYWRKCKRPNFYLN